MAARKEILKNNPSTTLAEELDNSETAIDVTSGAVFPATGDFRVIVDSEIMLVTARSTNTLTVVRGAEGTAAVTHLNAATITQILTEDGLERYLRDWNPIHNGNKPFRLVDENNVTLTSGSFTEVNGSSNPTPNDDVAGSITVRKTSAGAAVDWSIYTRTEPSTPVEVVAAFRFSGGTTGTGSKAGIGLGFRESSTGKFVVIRIFVESAGAGLIPNVAVTKYTDAATFSADYKLSQAYTLFGPDVWLKIQDTGTNLVFSISHDGQNYAEIDTQSRTDFMAGGPNQIFWGVLNQNNVSFSVMGTLTAWDEDA